MCTTHKTMRTMKRWNWEGDIIINDTKIERARKVLDTKRYYTLDIREFLASRENIVIRKELQQIENKLSEKKKKAFLSREAGSYDLRAEVIKEYISKNIEYRSYSDRGFDAWYFPAETLTMKEGDCEDRAFLLASMMLASGISPFNVRVCFGKISDARGRREHDHAWVAYKNEAGLWRIIEPYSLNFRETKIDTEKKKIRESTEAEYRPIYIMNNRHLWKVNDVFGGAEKIKKSKNEFTDYIRKRFFTGFKPAYGYKMHKEIVLGAIKADDFASKLDMEQKEELFSFASSGSYTDADYLRKFASMVSGVDITLNYDPRVHFDNGLIGESFKFMKDNLDAKTVEGLATAVHAASDIYAHTSYAHFADEESPETFKNWKPGSAGYAGQFENLPDYGEGSDFDLNKFSINELVYGKKDGRKKAAEFWKDRVISGRFGQKFDSKGILETTQFCPENFDHYDMTGALPHHNEIAMDSEKRPDGHTLYTDEKKYAEQYELRKKLAMAHVKEIFENWK